MGKALYRKYRSNSLDEIVGQAHVTDTLKRALERGEPSHAYLLTGPRGVGKTSVARILAHQVNGFDYSGEDNYLDIIEIDAASNRGIEEIRDLREKVSVAPAQGKYKVYIIDEVHMLTTPAFNALLKTLEEPPAHVIFILATTEAHKLPATIVSRTQRHNFRPVELKQVVDHLQHIAREEQIDIEPAALELIAKHGEGSFRDSISLLDQASGQDGKVSLQTINQLLGVPPQESIDKLIADLAGGQASGVVQQLAAMYDQGHRPAAIAQLLADRLRQQLLDGQSSLSGDRQLQLLEQLLDVPASFNPAALLEITLLKAALADQNLAPAPTSATPAVSEPVKPVATPASPVKTPNPAPTPSKPAKTDSAEPEQTKAKKHQAKPKAKAAAAASSPTQSEPALADSTSKPTNIELDQLWSGLLGKIKTQYNTLYGVLRMASPALDGDELVLTFAFAFHQKRMTEPKYQQIVLDAVQELSGQTLRLRCEVGKVEPRPINTEVVTTPPANLPDIPPEAPKNTDLAAISNIFGGGELLES